MKFLSPLALALTVVPTLAFAQTPAPAVAPTSPAPAEPAPSASSEPTTPAVAETPAPTPPAPVEVAPAPAPTAVLAPTAPLAPEKVDEKKLPNAGYDDKFFIQSDDGKFRLTFQSAAQVRFTLTGFENKGVGLGDQWYPAFSIPRVRFTFEGNVFTKDLIYKAQFEIGNGAAALRDAFLDYKITDGLYIRAGQDMKPFSREQVTGFRRQQFVDRSIIDFEMGNKKGGLGQTGRDIGLLINNDYLKAKGLEWAFGIYNGRGIAGWYTGTDTVNTLTPAAAAPVAQDPKGNTVVVNNNTPMKGDRFAPQFVARLGYNNGIKGYSFSDLEGGGFRYGVAASGMLDADVDGSDSQANAVGRQVHDARMRAEVDAIVKYKGFSAAGAYYIGNVQTGTPDWSARTWELNAIQAQAGYVIAETIEPAFRWAQLETLDTSVTPSGSKTINDYTVGLNVFFHGHKAKIANDFTIETTDLSGRPSAPLIYEFRTQAQVYF